MPTQYMCDFVIYKLKRKCLKAASDVVVKNFIIIVNSDRLPFLW